MKYRFPNLVVGMLTRESVRKALSNGISADQVRQQFILGIQHIHRLRRSRSSVI